MIAAGIDSPAIDVVITTGGTGITQRDVTPEALAPLVTKPNSRVWRAVPLV